jgi:hypothetical protein
VGFFLVASGKWQVASFGSATHFKVRNYFTISSTAHFCAPKLATGNWQLVATICSLHIK